MRNLMMTLAEEQKAKNQRYASALIYWATAMLMLYIFDAKIMIVGIYTYLAMQIAKGNLK